MFAIRPNQARARQLINAFYVMMGLTLLTLALAVWQYFLFQGFINDPLNIDLEKAELSDNLDRISGVIDITMKIVVIVLFIRWFRRAYYNLHMASPGQASYEEGWAAGAWFVPILNLFRPFQIMREIWVGTQRAIPHRIMDVAPVTIVGIWWALYLAMNISGNILFRLSLNVDSIDDLNAVSILSLIVEIVTVPAILVAVVMVKKASSFEDLLWDEAQNPSDSVFADAPATESLGSSSAS